MALLCAFLLWREPGESLADYLDYKVFDKAKSTTLTADRREAEGFARFLERYRRGLAIERAAVETMEG